MESASRGVERWHLSVWAVLWSCFFLSPVKTDYLSVHLNNFLNHSVSPCDDFHSHVCSAGMAPNQTAEFKSVQFYRDWTDKLDSRSPNNPIMNAIFTAQETGGCTFDLQNYTSHLQMRCGARFQCYLDEFYYYFKVYKLTNNEVPESLTVLASRAHRSANYTKKLMHATARMIWNMISSEDQGSFFSVVMPYVNLHDRLHMMTAIRKYGTAHVLGLDRLRGAERLLKKEIADRFKETPWLSDTDEFGLDRLSQFLTTLEDIKVTADFDKMDADLGVWRSVDGVITKKYFVYSDRKTGCARFDVMHPFITLRNEMRDKKEAGVDWLIFDRIRSGLQFNAFNRIDRHSIALLAPTFYPIVWTNSSDTTLLGSIAFTLAHELFHSFIRTNIRSSSDAFKQEAHCFVAHFNSSCRMWEKGTCNSGWQTFEEDGPDVEGLRVAYDILRKGYGEELLQEVVYEDLGITRQQAFFYAYAFRSCGSNFDPTHTDVHSLKHIRVNGGVSLMPEFSAAFKCKKDDAEYSDEKSSCYLFGPLAGSARSSHDMEPNEDAWVDEGSGEVLREEGRHD